MADTAEYGCGTARARGPSTIVNLSRDRNRWLCSSRRHPAAVSCSTIVTPHHSPFSSRQALPPHDSGMEALRAKLESGSRELTG